MSALDEAVEFFNPGPRARMCGDGAQADAYEAARAELSALRERLADVEAMLLGVRERRFDIWEDEDRATVGRMDADEWQVECEITDFDASGLPILTPEARARLRGEAAPQPRSET